MTTDTRLLENATTRMGEIATMGSAWLAMTHGSRVRSASREWTNTLASTMPMVAPRRNPMAASAKVWRAAWTRYPARDMSALRENGWARRPKMVHRCGRLESLAWSRWKGGWW